MPTNTTNTTDSALIEQIAASHLREDQKKDLEGLVGEMTEQERDDLIKLINESNATANDFEGKKKEKLAALNKEYIQKLDEAGHRESEYIRSEFEKFDKKQSDEEMKNVEAEIAVAANQTTHADQAEVQKKKTGKRHPVFKLFFFLLVLAGIILGVIYGLQYLNTV